MWLIRQDVGNELARASREGFVPPTEALTAFTAAATMAPEARAPRIMKVAGAVAEVRVTGALTPRPSFSAWLFGGGNTTYDDIRESLAVADADPAIKSVQLYIDSPGGKVDGLFETIAAIQAFSKPIAVRAACACSAAYAIAAATGAKIEATSPAAQFGSIGVAVTYLQDDTLVDITSTNAPEKRPDPATEEGKGIIRRHLDAIHELFVEAIAEGRGTKPSVVNADFGRGSVLLARDAKKAGLIDRIPPKAAGRSRADAADNDVMASSDAEEVSTASTVSDRGEPASAKRPAADTNKRVPPMNKTELQDQHPELFAAIVAIGREEGSAIGAEKALKEERDRVSAHLRLGEASGAIDIAIAAIKSGDGLTAALQAEYMSASMDRRDQSNRSDETKDAAEAVGGTEEVTTDSDLGDLVADRLDTLMGRKAS